jgi:hypothetical protein
VQFGAGVRKNRLVPEETQGQQRGDKAETGDTSADGNFFGFGH